MFLGKTIKNHVADEGTMAKKKKLHLTKNALAILEKRYLRKNEDGKTCESPEEMFQRVAQNIALAEAKYLFPKEVSALLKKHKIELWELEQLLEFQKLAKDRRIRKVASEFYDLLTSLEFLPNSPTLLNAGRKLQQLSACFVLPISDDIDSIFRTLHHAALVHKTGAGTGFNFSHLRPRGDVIESSGFTTGPVSFMKVYDAATNEVKLGGVLRGANMGILESWHPDIREFITIKGRENTLTNFNISVGIHDDFLKKYGQDESYALINPRTKEAVGKESAQEILKLMAKEAWATGDPGILFLDRIEKDNPTPILGKLECTDSCGEQPLLPYESCVLGSINLTKIVIDGKISYSKLKKIVWMAAHFLDNVIDMCDYPLPENRKMVEKTRKIGLGVMGFADLLIALNIPYNSERGIKVARNIMQFISREADSASENLAKKREVFPAWKQSVYSSKSRQFRGVERRVRNATRTTIAPTGTISIIAGCSSGIEPLFALSYARRTAEGVVLYYFNEGLKLALEKHNLFTDDIKKRIAEEGSLKNIAEIPNDIRNIFVVGTDVSPEYHIRMQAAFQEHVDNGISKTVTLGKEATPEDIEHVFLLAHELGCKGISVYRSGSREGQVIYLSSKRDEQITLSSWFE